MEINEAYRIAKKIDGWCSKTDGRLLYKLVLESDNKTIVELGTWKGKSAIYLAAALNKQNSGMLYCVDRWIGDESKSYIQSTEGYSKDQLFNEFLFNVSSLASKIKPLRGDTIEINKLWPICSKIGLLHIDAGHKYEEVKRDFELWSTLVDINGIIVFDDVPAKPGPTRLVSELPKQFAPINEVSNNKFIVKKVSDAKEI